MDTTDPLITFDAEGVCNHCRHFDRVTAKLWHPGPEGGPMLEKILDAIRREGKGKDYDCILGLSGGVDSSYLALKVKEFGLRPLVMHVDAGWNSELAVSNIEKIVKHCCFELHTHVMDWDEMRDLQLAYLRSGVANQDVPQDHAFFASLYHYATQNGIRTVLSGGNTATEAIFPDAWLGTAMDAINLRAIHRRFGTIPLRHFKTISFSQYYFWYPFVRGMRVLRPLNYLPYAKHDAIEELQAIGWRAYRGKHGESVFTRFFQNCYLPERFGYDKRKPHLSSLIVSGQITRRTALDELAQPLQTPAERDADVAYFCKKLGISTEQFAMTMAQPTRHYSEFPNWDRRYAFMKRMQRRAQRLTGKAYNAYS
jgi:aminotransferase